jgi:hypothetical protein
LGVRTDASVADIRSAYLAKARMLHPDRHAGGTKADVARAQRAMQEVNVAWSVLGDPRARRAYDESIRADADRLAASSPRAARPTGPPPVVLPDHDEDDERATPLPYLVRIGPVVLLLAVLGTIFVVTAFATGSKSVDTPTRQTVAPGTPAIASCVSVSTIVTAVDCDSANAMRVERYAQPGDDCGGAAVPIRWDDETVLCVRPQS